MGEPVDLLGIGVVSAVGADLETFFDALLAGRSGAVERPDLAALGIRGARVAEIRGLAEGDDPLVAAIESALADAGGPGVDPRRIALVVGTSAGAMPESEVLFRTLAAGDAPTSVVATAATYYAPALAAARSVGIRGPVRVVCAACASSLVAVGLARDLLSDRACDLAIAAGFDVESSFVHSGFDSLGALSKGVSRPYRAGRDGLLAGEGAGAVVLARQGGSRKPRSRVLGFGLSCDARHVTAPDPDGKGLAAAVRAALADAGLGPEAVDFVSGHGTGTPQNDPMETRALHAALGERAREVPVVSWKPVLGHAMGAAGILELAGAVLAMERGVLPGTPTSGDPDPDCDLDVSENRSRPIDARVGLKISVGFGGANAALLVGRP